VQNSKGRTIEAAKEENAGISPEKTILSLNPLRKENYCSVRLWHRKIN
jgi:hypothetical protein